MVVHKTAKFKLGYVLPFFELACKLHQTGRIHSLGNYMGTYWRKEFSHFDTKQWNRSRCTILNTCKNEGYLELGVPSSVQFTVNGETINTGSEELRYLGCHKVNVIL